MKISNILIDNNKTFPIVISPEVNNVEEMRKKYYFYGLNKYFGVLPVSLSNEKGLISLFEFISNASKTLVDLAYSLDELENKYFKSAKITKGVIEDTRKFFHPIYNNDVFSIKPELWDTLYKFLYMFYRSVLYDGLKIYVSYTLTKINKFFAFSILKTECSNDSEAEIKSFFEKIRRTFYKTINPDTNSDFRSYLLSLTSDAFYIEDSVLPNKTTDLNFYDAYTSALRGAVIKQLKLEELYQSFNNEFDSFYKGKLSEIFSQNNIFYQELVSIIGGTLADEYLKYLIS